MTPSKCSGGLCAAAIPIGVSAAALQCSSSPGLSTSREGGEGMGCGGAGEWGAGVPRLVPPPPAIGQPLGEGCGWETSTTMRPASHSAMAGYTARRLLPRSRRGPGGGAGRPGLLRALEGSWAFSGGTSPGA